MGITIDVNPVHEEKALSPIVVTELGMVIEAKDYEAALNSEAFKDLPVLFWYNGNGTADIAHDEHQVMFQTVLADMPERFTDGVNCCWIDFKGGAHAYTCWQVDLFNCLRVFFK